MRNFGPHICLCSEANSEGGERQETVQGSENGRIRWVRRSIERVYDCAKLGGLVLKEQKAALYAVTSKKQEMLWNMLLKFSAKHCF